MQWVANQSNVIGFVTPPPVGATTDAPPVGPPRRRPFWPILIVGLVGVVALVATVAAVFALRPPAEPAAVTTAPAATAPAATAPPTTSPAPTWPSRTAPTTAPAVKPPPKPVRLFDGKSLAGWHGVNNKTDHWAVRDGAVVGTLKPGGDQYLITDGEYGEFEFAFEFRWPDKPFHTSAFVLVAEEKGKVSGLEVNLNRGPDEATGEADRKWLTNGLYAAGGVHLLGGPSQPAQNVPVGKWNKVKVTHAGGVLSVEWNGRETFEEPLAKFRAKEKDVPAVTRTRGAIALRTHGGPVIEYRNLVVRDLK
jgi:hypothetical protein